MHNKALAGLARRQPEHGDRIECLVDFRVNPVAYLGIATDIGESYFPQCPHVPFRTGNAADIQLGLDRIAFFEQCGLDRCVCVRLVQFFGLLCKGDVTVIRIKIDQDAAATQNPVPLGIRGPYVRKRPCQISG